MTIEMWFKDLRVPSPSQNVSVLFETGDGSLNTYTQVSIFTNSSDFSKNSLRVAPSVSSMRVPTYLE